MAHNLSLLVVAEGVEHAVVLDMLTAWRCDIAQGYFFSRPVEAAAIEVLMASPSEAA